MQARRRAGLRSFPVPPPLREDHFVQGQVGDGAPEPSILRLKLLHLPNLIALQATVFLAPSIIGHLGHANRANRVRDRLALRDQYIDLSQLRDDLFRLVAFSRHFGPPVCQKTYLGVDQFKGGESLWLVLWQLRRETASTGRGVMPLA
jgi:hypothetical protein